MRDQPTLEKFLNISPGLFQRAREAGVLVPTWSPSNEAYYADEDVAAFDDFLAEWRRERRRKAPSSIQSPAPAPPVSPEPPRRFESPRGNTVRVMLCESCDRAISASGQCACSARRRS